MGSSWVTIICTFLIACSHWGPTQAASAPVIEAIHGHTQFSDGPHWDPETNVLYFVDIFGKTVNRFDSNSSIVTSIDLGDFVSLVIPIQGESDKFLVTVGDKIAVLAWDGVSPTPTFVKILGTVGKPNDPSRPNDGKADASGVLWAGTFVKGGKHLFDFVPEAGVIFSFSKWRIPQVHAEGLTLANGITWNGDYTLMYFVDTIARVIYVVDFDIRRSFVGNSRVIFDFKQKGVHGYPGGITIDCEDRLWVACMSAGQVIQIDPKTGEILRTVSIPSLYVTSVTFGGCDLDELYVTSANLEASPKALLKHPAPGCVFRITGLGVKGVQANRVSL